MPITSITSFLDQLKEIKKSKTHEYFFRGHDDLNYSLAPSIYRRKYIQNEDNIYKEIILRAPNDFNSDKTAIEKLVKMQHYGLPTRLLDITSNPLVALYFACATKPKATGEILIFKVPKTEIKYYDSDTVTILANIAKRPLNFKINELYTEDLIQFNKKEAILKLLHEIRDDKPQFLPIIDKNDIRRVIAVKTKHSNSRIIKQSGAFFLFGIDNIKSVPASVSNDWILKNFKTNNAIISNLKKAILDELDALGINEATLFPELENQSKYLRALYK
ncbi:FRG domain-containing protein [Pedobacter sp. N23S346]|uniref:FRG domain-containing protein n=1 Tax=Pedobacter sp. N23S346 TaxID=3402750 RepID=UPI003AC4ACA7